MRKGWDMQRLFRDRAGNIKELVNESEGISFQESPLDFFILLARYKFAARILDGNDTALDAGCGHGLGSVMLSKFARSVTGLDADQELVKHCQDTYGHLQNLSFIQGDLRDLSGLKGQFDTVVCLDVIEHFAAEDAHVVLDNLSSALTSRGMLVIGTPNARSQEFGSDRRKQTHAFEYDYPTFREMLGARFKRFIVFSMTDELVGTGFSELAWYFMGTCFK